MRGKIRRCPRPEQIQQQRRERKRAARQLRQRQQAQGLEVADRPALPNGKSPWATVAE